MFEIGDILLAIEREAKYSDGQVTFPAYLLEQLHNESFPDDQRYDYTCAPDAVR